MSGCLFTFSYSCDTLRVMKCAQPVTRILVLNSSNKWETVGAVPNNGRPYRRIVYPCGTCHACRVNHSKKWAARCCHEAQMHEENIFLNLTINDSSLPKLFTPVPLTERNSCAVVSARKRLSYRPSGDFSFDCLKEGVAYSLNYRPIQLFIKRLRRALGSAGKGLKYFCAAEYGPCNLRPHFHLILFGFRPSDLVPYVRRGKYLTYTSEFIQRLWSDPATGDPYGYAVIGSVSPASAQYCAQYSIKKQKGGVNRAEYYGELTPEFVRMSKGIGLSWLESYYSDVFPSGVIVLQGTNFCGVPRYYENWYKAHFPYEFRNYKLTQQEEMINASTRENTYQTADQTASLPHSGFYGPESYYDSADCYDGYVENKSVSPKLRAYYALCASRLAEAERHNHAVETAYNQHNGGRTEL